MLEPPEAFLRAANDLGIEFDAGDLDRLGRFLGLMLETNRTHNLTAITDPSEAWTRHILDALTLVPLVLSVTEGADPIDRGEPVAGAAGEAAADVSPAEADVALIDVGSGGGVPGVPLAIVLPRVRVTLLEPTGKKADFLAAAASELGLGNVAVLRARAERVGQDHRGHRERYDVATARALGHLAVVAELTVPLVRPGGLVLAVKGAKADREVEESGKAIGLLGARHVETVPTPTGRIVVLEKAGRTPRLYPRSDGEPKRRPLGVVATGRGPNSVPGV